VNNLFLIVVWNSHVDILIFLNVSILYARFIQRLDLQEVYIEILFNQSYKTGIPVIKNKT